MPLLNEVWGLSYENWTSWVLESSGPCITHRSGFEAGMTGKMVHPELSSSFHVLDAASDTSTSIPSSPALGPRMEISRKAPLQV